MASPRQPPERPWFEAGSSMSTRSVLALAVTLSAALALGACSSARLGGGFGGPGRSAQAGTLLPEPDPVEPVPSGPVTSAPLPPLAGQTGPGDIMAPGTTDIAALPPGAAA